MRVVNRFNRVKRALLGLLCLIPLAAPADTAAVITSLEVEYRTKILENDDFAAYRVSIPAGHATAMHRHDTDILTVFISGGPTRTVIKDEPPRAESIPAGSVRFRPSGFTHATENPGSRPFVFVILEFKRSVGARQQDLPAGSRHCAPDRNTACVEQNYLLCTQRVCAKSVMLGAGADMQVGAADSAQMLVAVTDARWSSSEGNGAHAKVRKSGDIEYVAAGAIKSWRNAAATPTHLVMLEFREAATP